MKNLAIFFGLIIVLIFSIAAIPDKPVVKKEIKAIVCLTPEIAITYINTYSSLGYTVKFVISQSVSTSIQTANNTGDRYPGSYRDINGKILLILEK